MHDEQIAEHGGLAGVRDLGLVLSALARSQNLAAYGDPDIADLCCRLRLGIARNHAFLDGNKRTAWVVAETFLLKNGYELIAGDEDGVVTMLAVAEGSMPEQEFAIWLRTYIRPLKSEMNLRGSAILTLGAGRIMDDARLMRHGSSILKPHRDSGGGIMRRILLAAVMLAMVAGFSSSLFAQGAPAQSSAGAPYTIEYYYKCQWGHQQEFLDLFLKNHWPLLKKIEATGRIVSLKIESPAYHTTEDGRWDYRVTIVYKNSTVATSSNPDEDGIHQSALAGPGHVQERRAAAVRDSAGALGFAGDGCDAGKAVSRDSCTVDQWIGWLANLGRRTKNSDQRSSRARHCRTRSAAASGQVGKFEIEILHRAGGRERRGGS